MIDPLSPMQIGSEIARLVEVLETRTDEYAGLMEKAAAAEAQFKRAYAEAMLDVISASRPKATVSEREAQVEMYVNDERETHLIMDAAAKSCKESLHSLRVQLDALRSLGANIRAQT